MPGAGRKTKAPGGQQSTGSHSIVDARPLAPLRRPSRQAPGRPRRCGRSAAPGRSSPRPVPARPASDAHIAWTSRGCPDRISECRPRAGTAPAGRHWRARSGPDLGHLRREAVGIDTGDQHPRGVGLAEPKKQPGALRDPVDRVDVGRRAQTWRASASRSAICTQRDASGVCIRRMSVDRNVPSRRPTASSPRPSVADRAAPTVHGSRRAQPGYSTGGRRRLAARLALETSSTAVSSAPAFGRRRRGATVRARWCCRAACGAGRLRRRGLLGERRQRQNDRRRCNQEELSAHCPQARGTATSIVWVGCCLGSVDKKNSAPMMSTTRTMRTINRDMGRLLPSGEAAV